MSTFYIDKDDGGYAMFRDTRERKNEIAYAKAGVIGKFVEMLAATLDLQQDGQSIVIEVKRGKKTLIYEHQQPYDRVHQQEALSLSRDNKKKTIPKARRRVDSGMGRRNKVRKASG